MSVEIKSALTKAEVHAWIHFPQILYQNEPCWTPPLWSDEDYSKRNAVLSQTDFVLHLAYRDGEVVGRNLVYVNHHYNTHYRTRMAMFGAFECIDDQEVCHALMLAAEQWAAGEYAEGLLGPIHPVAELWGFLVEGFDTPGVFLTPWNRPCYDRMIQQEHYVPVQDLFAYDVNRNGAFVMPERYEEFYHHFMVRNPDYVVRPVNIKKLGPDARAMWMLGNQALMHNWGFLPADQAVMQDLVRRLKPLIDKDICWFVEYRGRPVAFTIGYPDINIILKKCNGKLFPFGWWHLLWAKKTIRKYRLFGLVVDPAHHNKGLDAIMFVKMAEALLPRGIHLEANWILAENIRMNNSLHRLDLQKVKTYRLYEKRW